MKTIFVENINTVISIKHIAITVPSIEHTGTAPLRGGGGWSPPLFA